MTKRVSILGMGDSVLDFFGACRTMQGNAILEGEIWAINMMGIFGCDRVIAMDPLDVWSDRKEIGEIIAQRFSRVNVPIYTPHVHPGFPTSVRYPIEDVLRAFKMPYFNNSVPYAIALAMMEGFEEIWLFGCDYGYKEPELMYYVERGRACTEFWLGRAMERGIKVMAPNRSTILDASHPERFYGYTPEEQAKLMEILQHDNREPTNVSADRGGNLPSDRGDDSGGSSPADDGPEHGEAARAGRKDHQSGDDYSVRAARIGLNVPSSSLNGHADGSRV